MLLPLPPLLLLPLLPACLRSHDRQPYACTHLSPARVAASSFRGSTLPHAGTCTSGIHCVQVPAETPVTHGINTLPCRNPCDEGKFYVGFMDVVTNSSTCPQTWVETQYFNSSTV